jgi:hypothetical protein
MVGCGLESLGKQIGSTPIVGFCEYNIISDEKIQGNFFKYEKVQPNK